MMGSFRGVLVEWVGTHLHVHLLDLSKVTYVARHMLPLGVHRERSWSIVPNRGLLQVNVNYNICGHDELHV